MTEVDSLNLENFGDVLENQYDDLKKELDKIRTARISLNSFYAKDTDEKEINEQGLYQYRKNTQTEFDNPCATISESYGVVFLILKDINELFRTTNETVKAQAEQSAPTSPQFPIIFSQQSGQQYKPRRTGFMDWLFGREKDETPEPLKDSWMMTKNIQTETLNIPKMLQQMIDWHLGGITRNKYLKKGLEPYLTEEIEFYKENIVPHTSQLLSYGYQILSEKSLKYIQQSYSETLTKSLEEEKTKMFTQSMGGGGQTPSPQNTK